MKASFPIGQQAVAPIPWGHGLVILTKAQSHDEALFYVQKTIQNNGTKTEQDSLICHLQNDVLIWQKLSAKFEFPFLIRSEKNLYLPFKAVLKNRFQGGIDQRGEDV